MPLSKNTIENRAENATVIRSTSLVHCIYQEIYLLEHILGKSCSVTISSIKDRLVRNSSGSFTRTRKSISLLSVKHPIANEPCRYMPTKLPFRISPYRLTIWSKMLCGIIDEPSNRQEACLLFPRDHLPPFDHGFNQIHTEEVRDLFIIVHIKNN